MKFNDDNVLFSAVSAPLQCSPNEMSSGAKRKRSEDIPPKPPVASALFKKQAAKCTVLGELPENSLIRKKWTELTPTEKQACIVRQGRAVQAHKSDVVLALSCRNGRMKQKR